MLSLRSKTLFLFLVISILSSLIFLPSHKFSTFSEDETQSSSYSPIVPQNTRDLSVYLKNAWNDYMLNNPYSDFSSSYSKAMKNGIHQKTPPEKEGDTRDFSVVGGFSGTKTESATLVKVSPNLYIYIKSDKKDLLSSKELEYISSQFEDIIFPQLTSIFGDTDGILGDVDGDPHITLYLGEFSAGIAGYYDPENEFHSMDGNEREMIHISLSVIKNDKNQLNQKFDELLNTFIHEFQHLIHYNHDPYEHIWVNEGLSELASNLLGYNVDKGSNFRSYLDSPDTSLFLWDANYENWEVYSDYASAFLFFRYVTDVYGVKYISNLVNSSHLGAKGVQFALNSTGHSIDFFSLFHDWAMSLHINDERTNYSISTSIGSLKSQALAFDSDDLLKIKGKVVLSGIDAYSIRDFNSDKLISIENTGDTLLSLRTYSYQKNSPSTLPFLNRQTIGVHPGDVSTLYVPYLGSSQLYFHVTAMSDSLFPHADHYDSVGIGTPSSYALTFQDVDLSYHFDSNHSVHTDEKTWKVEVGGVKVSPALSNNDLTDEVNLRVVDTRFNIDKVVPFVYQDDTKSWNISDTISVQDLDPGNYTLQIVAQSGLKYGSFTSSTTVTVKHEVKNISTILVNNTEKGVFPDNFKTYKFLVKVNYTQSGNSTYLYNGVTAFYFLTFPGTDNQDHRAAVPYSIEEGVFIGRIPEFFLPSSRDLHFSMLFDSNVLNTYVLKTNFSTDSYALTDNYGSLSFSTPFIPILLFTMFVTLSIVYFRKKRKE